MVIAFGGIATGVGAILAPWLQGVKQQITERDLGEQVQRLREQNERTRLSLDADSVDRLDERFSSERLLDRRRWVAEYIKENKENFILDGDLQEV